MHGQPADLRRSEVTRIGNRAIGIDIDHLQDVPLLPPTSEHLLGLETHSTGAEHLGRKVRAVTLTLIKVGPVVLSVVLSIPLQRVLHRLRPLVRKGFARLHGKHSGEHADTNPTEPGQGFWERHARTPSKATPPSSIFGR